MKRRFVGKEFDIEIEPTKLQSRPAVSFYMSGPFRVRLVMTLADAESLAEMLVSAVRQAEEIDDEPL